MPQPSAPELTAWIEFVDDLSTSIVVPGSLPISDPGSFIGLAFETDRPEFALLQSSDKKIDIDRRRWKSRYQPSSGPKLAKLKAEKRQIVDLAQNFGVWGQSSTWKTWGSFFAELGTDARFRDIYQATAPLRKLTSQLSRLEPTPPRIGHFHADSYFRQFARNLRLFQASGSLVDPHVLHRLEDAELDIPLRFRALHQLKRVDLPMLQLGCLAACLSSQKWQKLSRLKAAFPLMEGLVRAARNPQKGVFWNTWVRWAYGQAGARSKRGWAAIIDRRLDKSIGPPGLRQRRTQETVNLVHRWMKGVTNHPSRVKLEAAFQGWAVDRALYPVDRFHGLVEWRLIYMLVFNLELTLSQWQRVDQLNVAAIKRAFDRGAKAARYFALRVT